MAEYEDENEPARGRLYIAGGPVVPPPADRERDARIKAYRARERARVVAAFDRFLERMFDDPYGERPEWADPPVWLRTEAERQDERPMHYGDDNRTACGKWSGMVYQYTANRRAVTCPACKEAYVEPPTAPVGIHQKAHYGVAEIQAAAESILGPSAGSDVVEALHRNPDYVPSDGSAAAGPCRVAYVYLFGRWCWLPEGSLSGDKSGARWCRHLSGHEGPHQPGERA